jgi:hypothetical protein
MTLENTIRTSLITIFLLLVGLGLQAQPPDGPMAPKEKLKALRIAYFSEKLNLNPQEAQVFWPVYNSFADEMHLIHQERRSLLGDLRDKALVKSEAELERVADRHIALMEQEVAIQKKYHSRFKEVLPIAKVLQFYKAEKEFPRWLLKQVRDQRRENGGGGRWQGRRRN